jgi:hypothetical protein
MGLFNSLLGERKPELSEQEKAENSIQVEGGDDPLATAVNVNSYPLVSECDSTHLRYIRDKATGDETLQFYGIFKDKDAFTWSNCTLLINGEQLRGLTNLLTIETDTQMNWMGEYEGVFTAHVTIDVPTEFIDQLSGAQIRWESPENGQKRDFTISANHANAFARVVSQNRNISLGLDSMV